MDRTWRISPWDWERTKDNYWKWWTTWFNVWPWFISTEQGFRFDTDFKNGPTHQRLPIMEQLQNEMLGEAIKRGTRPIEDQPDYCLIYQLIIVLLHSIYY